MSTSKITTLFLDIGGVLLTNGWDKAARMRAATDFKLNYPEIDERHHLTFDTYEEGKLSLSDYLEQVIFYEPRPFSFDDFKAYMCAQSQPFPDMIQLMRLIKQKHGLKVASINNEGRELMMYRIETFRLDQCFDFFVASCFVHLRKPDADMYRLALDVAQVEPEQALYIDDRPLFVQMAQKLGINALIHKDIEATRTALAGFGLDG